MPLRQLYPLRFDPIYQYRLWGGRRLGQLLSTPLPGDGPIGEAWVLSDRTDHQSVVANGSLKGQTLGRVIEQYQEQMMGNPYAVGKGDVWLLPAEIGRCVFQPQGEITLLDIAIP
jgi:mannose-6-phosphate isomerase class I